jgi:hypothetical protein
VVTNHQALEFFKTQRRLSHHQMWWMEYFSQFNYNIQYMKGTSNKVTDSLSQHYQSDTDDDIHPMYDYITADVQLDPEGKDLPWNQWSSPVWFMVMEWIKDGNMTSESETRYVHDIPNECVAPNLSISRCDQLCWSMFPPLHVQSNH